MPVLYCISSFEDTFYKKLQDKDTSSFINNVKYVQCVT